MAAMLVDSFGHISPSLTAGTESSSVLRAGWTTAIVRTWRVLLEFLPWPMHQQAVSSRARQKRGERWRNAPLAE
jgi:hypothetical protein